jgi:hypothetical protein
VTTGFSFFPSIYPVVHIARAQESSDLDPDTGNPKEVTFPPVVRYAQAISQFGRERPSSNQVISAEFVQRVETAMRLTVAEPTVYATQDRVLLFPELDDNKEWVPGTGIAFWVDGLFEDQRLAPWQPYFQIFGGFIMLRRVT